MTEGGTDLRILTSRTSNEILSDVRGTKRKLEVSENIEDNVETQRIERPSAPKRRRHSNDGVVGVVKKNLNRVYEYINTFLFGCSENDNSRIHSESVQTDALQDQAVDMSQPANVQNSVPNQIFSKIEEKSDRDEPEMIDTGSKTFNISKDDPKSSTPFEKFNESNRQSFGFGLQASGPLSTKAAMANIRFHGRQFAIATQEKRDAMRKSQQPSILLDQIRQKNISATTSSSSPYRPLSIIDKTFRDDLARGVRRSKEGGAITRNKTPTMKRNAIINAYREEELKKYRAILESSPAAGLKANWNRSPMTNNSTRTPIRKDLSVCNRTSLFKNPSASTAINVTRYSRNATIANTQRISNNNKQNIPVVNLDDDNTKSSGRAKTTAYKPKYQGPDSDVSEILDKYSPCSTLSKNKESISIHNKENVKTDKLNGLESKLQEEKVYKDEYLQELLEKYVSRSSAINRSIKEESIKVDHHKERRIEAEKSIEARLKKHLQITEVAIPEPEAEESPEEDELTLPEITDEMEEVVASALQSGSVTLIDAYKIPITGKDVNTLRGLNWLNDEVINFYLQMIVERSNHNESGWPKVYATNTFFYPKLMQSGHSALKRWTRKVDIFSYDLILVPVHLGMHWCLATIDLKSKGVFYYDSMGGDNISCLDALLRYLQDEHMDKKKSPFDTSSFNSTIVKDIPQQMNGSDCGMFTCKFAEYLSRDAPITFSQEDMPYFRRRMIYEIVKNNIMHP